MGENMGQGNESSCLRDENEAAKKVKYCTYREEKGN